MNRLTLDGASLKSATRRGVALAGGPNSLKTRVAPSHISEYGNIAHSMFVPIDVAVEIDRAAKQPVILRAMAERLGYDLVPREQSSTVQSLTAAAGNLAREAGELVSTAIEVGSDGKLSPNEAKRILSEAADAEALIDEVKRPALHALAGAA